MGEALGPIGRVYQRARAGSHGVTLLSCCVHPSDTQDVSCGLWDQRPQRRCLAAEVCPSERRKPVVHSPDVTTPNPHDIDWAEVAARARADLGDEQIARFSDRLRKAMNVTADTFRSGVFQPGDPDGPAIGQPLPARRRSPGGWEHPG